MLLADRTIVIADPDSTLSEALSLELRRQGARCFVAPDAMRAGWGSRETLPDVLITELELPDLRGEALLLELRSSAECAKLPAVALAGNRSLLGRVQARPDGFEKCLLKPFHPSDVVDAVCCIAGRPQTVDPFVIPALEEVSQSLARHDYRHLLALLNVSSHYRYSALFRREGPALRSVWTYDRKWPFSDPFPFNVLLEETPCAIVLGERRPLLVEDALTDLPRVRTHPDMRAFVGVPLADRPEPTRLLCHFDSEPSPPDEFAVDLLERTARLFGFASRRAPTLVR
jgi:CheY-like chemotaxis protein